MTCRPIFVIALLAALCVALGSYVPLLATVTDENEVDAHRLRLQRVGLSAAPIQWYTKGKGETTRVLAEADWSINDGYQRYTGLSGIAQSNYTDTVWSPHTSAREKIYTVSCNDANPIVCTVVFGGDPDDNPDIGLSFFFLREFNFSAECGTTDQLSAGACEVGKYSGNLSVHTAVGTCSELANKSCTTNANCTETCNDKAVTDWLTVRQHGSSGAPKLIDWDNDGELAWYQRKQATPTVDGGIRPDADGHIEIFGDFEVVDNLYESYNSGSCVGLVQGDCTIQTAVGTTRMWFTAITAGLNYTLPECTDNRGLFIGFINDIGAATTLHTQSGDTYWFDGSTSNSIPDHKIVECRCGLINNSEWVCQSDDAI